MHSLTFVLIASTSMAVCSLRGLRIRGWGRKREESMGGWPTRRAVSFLVSIAETEIRPGFAKAGRFCCATLYFFKACLIFKRIAKYAECCVATGNIERK